MTGKSLPREPLQRAHGHHSLSGLIEGVIVSADEAPPTTLLYAPFGAVISAASRVTF